MSEDISNISTRVTKIMRHPYAIRAVIVGVLLAILYFGILPIYSSPLESIYIQWEADGRATVLEPATARIVAGPAMITGLQPGDWLVSINGVPLTQSDLSFRFGLFNPSYLYELQRGELTYWAEVEQPSLSLLQRLSVWMPFLVALETWALGALVLLFAPQDNQPARLLGVVVFALALCLIADRSFTVGLPGSKLTLGVLTPIASVGYIELALLHDNHDAKGHAIIRVLYLLTLPLVFATLIHVFVLPPNSFWAKPTWRTPYLISYGMLGLSQMGLPVLTLVRARLSPSPKIRRQLLILGLGTGLAIAPFVLLDLLPLSLGLGSFIGEYLDLLLPLGGLIPATFGYVILRHRYLGLDVFVVRATTVIAALLLTFVFYVIISSLMPVTAQTVELIALLTVLVAVTLMFAAGWRLRIGVERIVFGSSQDLEKIYNELAAQLTREPQIEVLAHALLDRTADTLHTRQAALFLFNQQSLESVYTLRVECSNVQPTAALGLSMPLLRQINPEDLTWIELPWAFLVVPIQSKSELLGYAVYGEKVDGPFNSREVEFIIQVASTSVVALENIRLIAMLREMSRRLLSNSAAERMAIASRLHDEPLQRASAIVYSLEQSLNAIEGDSLPAQIIKRHIHEMRDFTAEMRQICAGLRPRILDQGVRLALSEVIKTFQEEVPTIHVDFIMTVDEAMDAQISPQALEAIYHVTIEALNNVRKHSGASRVIVTAEGDDVWVQVKIHDNGRGLGMANIDLNSLVREKHLGLALLFEWAEIAGGRLEISDGPSGGTQLSLAIPSSSQGVAAPIEPKLSYAAAIGAGPSLPVR